MNLLRSREEANNDDVHPERKIKATQAHTQKNKPAPKEPAVQPAAEQDKPEYAGIAVQRGIGMVLIFSVFLFLIRS